MSIENNNSTPLEKGIQNNFINVADFNTSAWSLLIGATCIHHKLGIGQIKAIIERNNARYLEIYFESKLKINDLYVPPVITENFTSLTLLPEKNSKFNLLYNEYLVQLENLNKKYANDSATYNIKTDQLVNLQTGLETDLYKIISALNQSYFFSEDSMEVRELKKLYENGNTLPLLKYYTITAEYYKQEWLITNDLLDAMKSYKYYKKLNAPELALSIIEDALNQSYLFSEESIEVQELKELSKNGDSLPLFKYYTITAEYYKQEWLITNDLLDAMKSYKYYKKLNAPELALSIIEDALNQPYLFSEDGIEVQELKKLSKNGDSLPLFKYYTITAEYYKQEWLITNDPWNAIKSSKYYRKSNTPELALSIIENVNILLLNSEQKSALYTTKGAALKDIGSLEEALICANEAIHNDSSHYAYNLRGAINYILGNPIDAENDFTMAEYRGGKSVQEQMNYVKSELRREHNE